MSGTFALGPCWACGNLFAFNPELVPSIVVDEVRQPLCLDCVGRANALRREQGQPVIVPLPGAYGVAE